MSNINDLIDAISSGKAIDMPRPIANGISEPLQFMLLTLVRFDYVKPDFACVASRGDGAGRNKFGSVLLDNYASSSAAWALEEYARCKEGEGPSYRARMDSLSTCPAGSLGQALLSYYELNPGLPSPDKPSLFPKGYVSVHDVHHILIGTNTSKVGELITLAFEMGLCNGGMPGSFLPVIAQLAVFVEGSPLEFDPATFQRSWAMGAANHNSLLQSWDFWSEKDTLLVHLREKLGITALSSIYA